MEKKMMSNASTKKQACGYANNKAGKKKRTTSISNRKKKCSLKDYVPDEWFYYSNPFDFE